MPYHIMSYVESKKTGLKVTLKPTKKRAKGASSFGVFFSFVFPRTELMYHDFFFGSWVGPTPILSWKKFGPKFWFIIGIWRVKCDSKWSEKWDCFYFGAKIRIFTTFLVPNQISDGTIVFYTQKYIFPQILVTQGHLVWVGCLNIGKSWNERLRGAHFWKIVIFSVNKWYRGVIFDPRHIFFGI